MFQSVLFYAINQNSQIYLFTQLKECVPKLFRLTANVPGQQELLLLETKLLCKENEFTV